MSDAVDTPAAARRRRWISLGEVVAVLALVISAASFWDARQQRQAETSAARPAPAKAAPLVLTGSVEDGGARLRLAPAGDAVLQTQTITFPSRVSDAAAETTGNAARIDADWFAAGVRAAYRDDNRGRVPVGIVTHYLVDGRDTVDRAIYDVAFTVNRRLLRPDEIVLEGLTLVARGQGEGLQAKLDARWKAAHPAQS